jgi:hypothetical protein
VAGAALAGVAAVGGVAVATRRPALPLTLAALRPLVGQELRVEDRTVTLSAIEGVRGGGARDDAFRLLFTADRADLPGGTRTFAHGTGDLVLHTEPVGAAGTTLEAVVLRTS